MTQTEAENGGAGMAGTGGDGLDDLRADLARMILNEAGQAVSRNPDLPLSLTLVRAIERQADQSAERAGARTPTAEALADAVLDAVGPELIRIARAAGTGDAVALARRRSQDGFQGRTLIGVAVAVVAGILLFVAGFVTAKLLPDAPAPSPVVAAAPFDPGAEVAPAPVATTGAAAPTTAPPTPTGRPTR